MREGIALTNLVVVVDADAICERRCGYEEGLIRDNSFITWMLYNTPEGEVCRDDRPFAPERTNLYRLRVTVDQIRYHAKNTRTYARPASMRDIMLGEGIPSAVDEQYVRADSWVSRASGCNEVFGNLLR